MGSSSLEATFMVEAAKGTESARTGGRGSRTGSLYTGVEAFSSATDLVFRSRSSHLAILVRMMHIVIKSQHRSGHEGG
jgi:hypothetical protein